MLQTQYPYIDEFGTEHFDLIKTYSDQGYKLYQLQTGLVYDEAVDVYPSKFAYDEIIPAEKENN